AAPGDILEFTSGAGAAAYVVGCSDNVIATIDATMSLATDTPDFWRRGLSKFPEHVGRFTAEPGYFTHVQAMANLIFEQTGLQVKDFTHVIFHQPNARFPQVVASKLGFTKQQINEGFLVKDIGNAYSANTMLGLTAVLDIANPGEKILLISYGSGSGCDAFVLTATEQLPVVQKRATLTRAYISHKKYVSYTNYRYNLDLVY
ncbi:hydroxymethylglutaryl-CoA synthase, partial [Candidatus Dependentiae bacterium]|nr:hydroxymethylglutaryl-CoA synthase [Candidatus Dependentiae bacterium]